MMEPAVPVSCMTLAAAWAVKNTPLQLTLVAHAYEL